MVRFTMKVFLKYFTENIVEAVGGYKDFADRHGGLQRDWTSPRAGDFTIFKILFTILFYVIS